MVIYKIANTIKNLFKNTWGGVNLMKNGQIQAVHQDNLVEFLKSIEEYDRVINGQAKCYFCGNTVTIDNIQSIFPLNGEINYCCNDEKCYTTLIDRGNIDA